MTTAATPQELASPSDIQPEDTVHITYDLGIGFNLSLQGKVKTILNTAIYFHSNIGYDPGYTLFDKFVSRQILLLDRPKKFAPITPDQLLTLPFGTVIEGNKTASQESFEGILSSRFQNKEGFNEVSIYTKIKGTVYLRWDSKDNNSFNFCTKTLKAKI